MTVAMEKQRRWPGLIEHYREFLPVSDSTPVVTLLEGNTPLIEITGISEAIPKGVRVYVKYEGLNPTGSFKDRGMTMAISKAAEEGAKAVICASTGNTSASAAAYAARAGMRCYVVVEGGAIAMGKLSQALIHGAKMLSVDGNFDTALRLVREVAQRLPVKLVNSVNPYRLEGQKTAAFEVCDQLGEAPDFLAIPVGNAGNISAYWKGFKEYRGVGRIGKLPVMLGFQAAGAAPLVEGRVIPSPKTIATAIKIGDPASRRLALAARDESGGRIEAVSDEEILDAYQKLARMAGVFCEPASAASVAGVVKLAGKGFFQQGQRIVCVLTGHGLKDPDRAIASAEPPVTIPATIEALTEAIKA
ncbi:MAG: threonine synthase [Firmicutes bacterium]|nr:threonine synthase [Bacillota bacterium]